MHFRKLLVACVALFTTSGLFAQEDVRYRVYEKPSGTYEITITNLTYNQVFSPVLAVSHRRSIGLFSVGEAASEGIATMAESGDTSVLLDSVAGDRRVRGSGQTEGVVPPGQSATWTIPVNRGGRLSVVSMLVNTNDAFLALNSVRAPRQGQTETYIALAYDAGSEINDELCANIPGPACGGEGNSAEDGEGFIHIHRGFHGVGDLAEAAYDWRNPVAVITVTRK